MEKISSEQIFVAQGWWICCRLVGGTGGSCRTGWIEGFPGLGWAPQGVIGHHVGARGGGGFGSCGVFLGGLLEGGRLLKFPERSPAWRPTPAENLRRQWHRDRDCGCVWLQRGLKWRVQEGEDSKTVKGSLSILWNRRFSPWAASLLHTGCWSGGARVSMVLHPLWSYSGQIPTHTHTQIRPNKCAKGHTGSTAERVSSHVYHILLIGGTEVAQLSVFSLGTRGLLHVKSHLEPETCHHLQGDTWGKPLSLPPEIPHPHPPHPSTCLVAYSRVCRANR